MSAIQDAIAKLAASQDVDETLAAAVAGEILSGAATPGQIGAFLMGLRLSGERPHHLLSFARSMREHASPVEIEGREDLVDTCGTGGDHAGTFNISTAAAIIAAGAGARVAKHGNRAVTGKCGSADVLGALGVKVDLAPAQASRSLAETGFAFFFAPSFHGAMRHAGPVRREIGVRTIFNMLGPLSNPAGAGRQVVGVYDGRLARVFAETLGRLGARHVMVVHGSDGLDEITLTGETAIAEARGGEVKEYRLDPRELGLELCTAGELAGGSAEANAEIIRAILAGARGPRRDVAELNAAAAIYVGGKAASLAEGLAAARAAVDSGAAARTLENVCKISREV